MSHSLLAERDVADVQEQVLEILDKAGVPTGPGIVEVRPCVGKFIRVPLGAGGVLLDFDTLTPTSLEYEDVVSVVLSNKGAAGAERLAHSTNATIFIPPDSIPRVRKEMVRGRRNTASGQVSKEHAENLWQDGLLVMDSRFDSMPALVGHIYYNLKFREPAAMKSILKQWLRDKHNGMSGRYLSSPESVMKNIDSLVDDHLEWVRKNRPMLKEHPDSPYEEDLHLAEEDFELLERLFSKINHEFPKTSSSIRKVVEGLASLLLYAKRKSGGNLSQPVFAMSREGMRKWLSRWSMKKGSPFYYKRWLEILEAAGLISVIDAAAAPGKCRRYRLNADLSACEEAPGHKGTADAVLLRLMKSGKKRNR